MPNLFIPESFEPPIIFDSEHFHFRVLEEEVAELDFEAVMSSQKRLQGVFGPKSMWPKSNMTLEENIASLKVHKREFDSRDAFAYSVFNNSKKKCLGSVYIDPSQSSNYDCEVYLWIRDDNIFLDNELYQIVFNWLQEAWPFSKIAFPGRDILWEDWAIELNVV
ncbi:hypothetical protein [Pseudoalteromonas luteoviolacea]|uniref:GNAT family N-acetyltransferase n=1 Tax=Pseudoalteromonas luteoviolacea S4054 TaxID=1129367 RepID=A0A0F6AHI6_9GAMM|nr:hypothetical protein [Pseudoalteromonas luteoviolacea]AOT08724.1 hypothetical protein S4054249_13055 [Pseudoalteromonas luteoviolacea]AOT13639.1 hypothetical protein S40542_13030 [Pseudoalteromonas luteoviolacea]AOT18552.1 hypothetical protein S4054_13030 [Pseudoalteromonas luteoviolacea]KKE85618.1 hypothetical protein N479_25475 [Pseudoalteromonas luteoviolacea S4054]KZN68179.1 hypothetical protein N481_23295 [Pseudoalteromonas luteoviolacea S4047-1]